MAANRKNRIRKSFSRAASTYDDYAYIQRRSADYLKEIVAGAANVETVLEIGCGTGNFTACIADVLPDARIFSLDVSFPMARRAACKFAGADRVHFMNADAELLPLPSAPLFDLVTSNGVLQWLDDLEGALANIRGVLRPGGQVVLSMFGSRTLSGLAEAIRAELAPEASIPAERFPDYDEIRELFRGSFQRVEFVKRTMARTYKDFRSMLRALKATGVAPGGGRPLFTTRGQMEMVEKNYMERTGRVTASYEIIFVKACSGA